MGFGRIAVKTNWDYELSAHVKSVLNPSVTAKEIQQLIGPATDV